jgi:hypothetical protein
MHTRDRNRAVATVGSPKNKTGRLEELTRRSDNTRF